MDRWPPGSPQPTRRATSRAPGARGCWPTSAAGCGASPTTSALILPVRGGRGRARASSGASDLGLQIVPLEAIVGTVDRAADFDRGFRPTSPRLRSRWERIAAAQRRGEALPPISLYRVGDLYFVRDGHHRVSVAQVARAHTTSTPTSPRSRPACGSGATCASATCRSRATSGCSASGCRSAARSARGSRSATRGTTACSPRRSRRGASARCRTAARLHGPRRGGRRVVHSRVPPGRRDAARAGGLVERGETETDAYMRISRMRYRALRTHEWSDEVLERGDRQAPGSERRHRARTGRAPAADVKRQRAAAWPSSDATAFARRRSGAAASTRARQRRGARDARPGDVRPGRAGRRPCRGAQPSGCGRRRGRRA